MASDYKSDEVWIVRDVMDIKRNVVDDFFGKETKRHKSTA